MKSIVALSDTHGIFPQLEKTDYVLIGGDISPVRFDNNLDRVRLWMYDQFIPWLKELDSTVILIGGNHDFFLEKFGKDVEWPENVHYLYQSEYNDQHISVYGTPLCKPFYNWAFMPPLEVQRSEFVNFNGWSKSDHRTKIILSHDAMYGHNDLLLDESCPWYTSDHIGNTAIQELVIRTAPDYFLHGHLHSTGHDLYDIGQGTSVRCVAVMNERYQPHYEPFYFEVPNMEYK